MNRAFQKSVGTLPAMAVSEASRVAGEAARDLERILADLKAWVDLDSPSDSRAELDRLAAVIATTAESYGLETELVSVDGGPHYLHASLAGWGTARVALLCHHDTVFPSGTARERPFGVDGDRAYGPGVADMKGGIAVALHTARLLALGPRPFCRLEVVSVPDEELREGGPPATIKRLHGFDAVLCMECGRANHAVVSSRKAGYWFKLDAAGRPAHAGVAPDEGRNAIIALCHEALRLAALHRARPELTLQVTSLVGGQGLNTVPGTATLSVDLRAVTMADLIWARTQTENIGRYDGVELHLETISFTPPLERTPVVAALAEMAIDLGALVGHVFGEASTGGASDGSYTAAAGIPTLDGLGPTGDLDHTPDEYIELPTIPPRCGVIAGLVAAVDAGLLGDGTPGTERQIDT